VSDRLSGCYVKLERAGVHLDALKRATTEVFGSEPERIPGDYDRASGQYLFRAQRAIDPPLNWSGIVGDVVHNLFAALDYLAWELVAANGAQGTPSTAFPIFVERDKYQKDAPKKMRGMHPGAQSLIQRVQPFQVLPRDGHPSEHPLAMLYGMEIQDKHRSLVLAVHVGDVRLDGLPREIHMGPGPLAFPFRTVAVGDLLCTVEKFDEFPDLALSLVVPHRLSFDRDFPIPYADVIATLAEIKRYIETVVISPLRRFAGPTT
jgi:hypothetical protein